MDSEIFIITEQNEGIFRRVTFEMVSEGRRLADRIGTNVTAAVIGNDSSKMVEQLERYGADRILINKEKGLSLHSSDRYISILEAMISAEKPKIILIGATLFGKEIAARLAAKLEIGLAMDCIGFELEKDELCFLRPIYGGKVISRIAISSVPTLVAVRTNVMAIVENPRQAVSDQFIGKFKNDGITVIETRMEEDNDKIELSEADVIIAGGRGTGGDFTAIEELAKILNAGIGASRSAVDESWRPYSNQIGQTGKVVAPKLYVACGISGAIQHLAGMSTAKYVVAINKDVDAPIFKKVDLGVVADMHQVVPAITREVRKIHE